MDRSRGFLFITYKLYHHLNKLDGEHKSHCLNVFLSVMKYAWKKNGYEARLRHETIHKDTGLCRTTIKSCLSTLNKLNVVKSFRGKSEQIPPVYSALKIDGKRSYELARKGEKIILKKREIEIFKFNLLNFKNLEIDCEIECSKGTYIRTIASDMGKKLDSGAYLKYLERYSVGEYSIKNCLQIDEIKDLLSLQ